MKRNILLIILSVGLITHSMVMAAIAARNGDQKPERILKVPADYNTIAAAVGAANDGDWVIIAPGNYVENQIRVDKAIVISSEWKMTGDESLIEKTVIDVDSETKNLFILDKDGIEISGLRIHRGDNTLNIRARVAVKYNHFVGTKDAMSFEANAGGYAGYNTVENDRDDAIDCDLRLGPNARGSDILIEHNVIRGCRDDGIEIRLYNFENQNINYIVRENNISKSGNAGIQIISYDIFTGKTFQIHHNVITECKTGLGCQQGRNSKEDLNGSTTMDEQICFFNNTLIGNQMGATGANNVIAVNNLVQGNALGGFKRFYKSSAIVNNLFFNNGGDDLIEIAESVEKEGNIFSIDPKLDPNTLIPAKGGPGINAGAKKYAMNGKNLVEVAKEYYAGPAPDIGAMEANLKK